MFLVGWGWERLSLRSLTCFYILKQALIVKLKDPDPDPNPGVINNVLATIGELAQVRNCSFLRRHHGGHLDPKPVAVLEEERLCSASYRSVGWR